MTPKNDPAKPKPNPELRFLERILLDAWREFRAATDYGEKRGRAMILQAHLDEWLGQPEHIQDLKPGAHPDAKGACCPDDILKGAEMPFDRGGPASDAFFYSPGGTLSRVYTQAERDADPELSRRFGYYIVTVYEKIHATRDETRNRFSSEEAVRRHIPSSGGRYPLEKDRYDIFLDPAGSPDPKRTYCIARYRTRKAALDAADRLAGSFGIRFLVARIIGWVDNH